MQHVSDETCVSNTGMTYTQMDRHSSDGNTRMGDTATGLGAVFNDRED